jgi:hypothetical protein
VPNAAGPRSGAPGSRALALGETEDHLHSNPSAEEPPELVKTGGIIRFPGDRRAEGVLRTDGFIASCDTLYMRHGWQRQVFIEIDVRRASGGPMRIAARRFHRSEESDVRINRQGRTGSRRINGFIVRSKKVHELRGVDEEFIVSFRISGRGSSGVLDCRVIIFHTDRLPPRGDPPPPPNPPDPPGFGRRGGGGPVRPNTFNVECLPDPLETDHGTKASTIFYLKDGFAGRRPPPIAVAFRAPPSTATTRFTLLTSGPGQTQVRTPLSHHGVLADPFTVHALANPVESFALVLRFARVGEPVLERTCRVNVRHSQGEPPFNLGPGPVPATGFYNNGQGSGSCANDFTTGLQITAPGNGMMEIHQPSTGDRASGPVNPDGEFHLRSAGETYDGKFTGRTGTGVYTYTSSGCSKRYDFRIELQ